MRKKKTISVVLDPQLIDKIDTAALAENRSKSNLIENILKQYFDPKAAAGRDLLAHVNDE